MRRGGRLAAAAGGFAAIACGLALIPALARAQAIERHLPPAPTAPAPQVLAPTPLAAPADDRPIAGPLRQIRVLGPSAPVVADTQPVTPGVDVAGAEAIAPDRLARALRPFLGRPLSRRLIGEAEAAAVRAYRQAGLPFVSATAPPQEVGAGRLQLRIVVYRLGKRAVRGVDKSSAGRILAAVRAPDDQPIAADLLVQDLDWLDRYPFRTVAAGFSPGAAPGQTDLTLTVTPSRPYQVYAGYADSGSPATGRDRWFAGALVGLPLAVPTLVSYQMTASPDAVQNAGELVGGGQPRYLSHSARLVSYIAPRQDLELTVDVIQTSQPVQDFQVRSRILEMTLADRFALSNLSPSLPGDLVLGVEAKGETRATWFGGAVATSGDVEIYQLLAGWSVRASDALGQTALDLSLHLSPGGLTPQNRTATLSALTQGRVSSARYGYLGFDLTRATRLPFGLSLSSEAIGLYAPRALPDTEQAALGGGSAVRGYSVDDGAYDRALVLRNTLSLPWPARAALGPAAFDRPFVFGDVGYGEDQGRRSVTLASVGVGQGLRLGPASFTASLCIPLIDGPAARAGRLFADVRLTAAY